MVNFVSDFPNWRSAQTPADGQFFVTDGIAGYDEAFTLDKAKAVARFDSTQGFHRRIEDGAGNVHSVFADGIEYVPAKQTDFDTFKQIERELPEWIAVGQFTQSPDMFSVSVTAIVESEARAVSRTFCMVGRGFSRSQVTAFVQSIVKEVKGE